MTNKVIEYTTVTQSIVGKFWSEVNRLIQQGWTPYGGLLVTRHGQHDMYQNYHQAMVKYES